jgi:hypothetical protein
MYSTVQYRKVKLWVYIVYSYDTELYVITDTVYGTVLYQCGMQNCGVYM